MGKMGKTWKEGGQKRGEKTHSIGYACLVIPLPTVSAVWMASKRAVSSFVWMDGRTRKSKGGEL